MKYLKIKKNSDFQKLFKKGKKAFSPYLTLIYFPSDKLSMGIAISKKHGKAVTRNAIKRLVREAFKDSCDKLQHNYSIIVLPRIAEEYSYHKMKDGFNICFKKVNLCEKS
ncbi:MAG: ribonuclease P protein component [Clostridiales bacterium]|nr:ribonuclease P protein component [Clostridiales bacterium]